MLVTIIRFSCLNAQVLPILRIAVMVDNSSLPVCYLFVTMMASSNGNIFCVTGHLCGNSPVPGEFPTQRPVTRSFDVFFDLRPNKRLSNQT